VKEILMLTRYSLLGVVAMVATVSCAANTAEEEESVESSSEELTSFCWFAGGDCRGVPWGNWRSANFWADFYLAKYARQRKEFNENIEPGPTPLAKPRTVVLVTGVTIKAAWFDGIAARLQRDGFRTVMYEPPALLTGDLFQASKDFGAFVERVQQESGDEKVDILAECTGGLIARHYVQSLGGESHVSRLVTFVSPQHGIGPVPLVARITGWPSLYDLSPGSSFLRAVNDAPLPATVPITSIYTCNDEYITPYSTSYIPGATNIDICGGRFVGHFETMYNRQIYLMMHDALVK
jgi:triacylglycerol esterase/lipase EstA (alpha/beta hydrolase family)